MVQYLESSCGNFEIDSMAVPTLLCNIRRIRHLSLSTATALANSLVSSKLDYCNSLYSGISQTNLNKLQRIQNSLARNITNTSKYQHITPTLTKLHWLPIKQKIEYKLCLLTYKTLTNQQPTCRKTLDEPRLTRLLSRSIYDDNQHVSLCTADVHS